MLIYSIGLITVLLCCCGLALDLGSFELTKVRMQNAADAAALGAMIASESGGTMSVGGAQDATQNGFTSGVAKVTVTIANPPTSGTYAGNANAVQAIITKQVTGIFIPTKFTLVAKATAIGSPTCVYLLNQYTSQQSLGAVNQSINATCSFYLGVGYSFTGGGTSGSIGSQFYVANNSSASTGPVTPAAIFNAPVQPDPLAYIATPTFGACKYTNLKITSATTLTPGVYCGTLTVNTTALVTMQPGTYVILGSLNWISGNVSGAGVTLFLSQGNGYAYAASGIGNLNGSLSAPTTGNLQGILIYTDRNLPAGKANLTVQNFNSGTTLDGIIYLPGQELSASNVTLQGINYFGLVADYLHLNNTNFSPGTNYSSLSGGSPFNTSAGGAGLVE